MTDHTRMPGPHRDREALDIADVQSGLSRAIDAVNRLGADLAAAVVKNRMAEEQPARRPSAPWSPNPGVEGKVTLSEAVGQALGTASMAWTPRPDGVFDSREAVRVYEGIMAWLSDWADEVRKEAAAATQAKIVYKILEHRDQHNRPGGAWAAIEELRMDLEGE